MEEQIEDVAQEEIANETDSYNKFFDQDGLKGYDYDQDEEEEIEDSSEDNDEEVVDEVETDTDTDKTDTTKKPEVVDSERLPTIFELKDKAKTTFSSDKERADYYENVIKHNEKLFTEDYSKMFLDTYSRELLQTEKDAETLIEMQKALNSGNRLEFLRQHFGEDLKQFGYDIKYSDDEINDIVSTKLGEKFGEDWQDKFDVNQLKIPTSTSSKIAREQAKILNELEAENEKFGDPVARQQAPQVSEEERQKWIENEYNEFKALGMPKEEYNAFLNKATEYMPKLNLKDLYKVIHFEDIISNVKETAMKEAKKQMYNEIKGNGAKPVASEASTEKPTARRFKLPENESDFYSQKKERELKKFL